jgi:preprotein translocase subunit SecG
MAELQKGSGGTVVVWIIGVCIVVFVMMQIKGSQDGCEASGRQSQGLTECVEPSPSAP